MQLESCDSAKLAISMTQLNSAQAKIKVRLRADLSQVVATLIVTGPIQAPQPLLFFGRVGFINAFSLTYYSSMWAHPWPLEAQ